MYILILWCFFRKVNKDVALLQVLQKGHFSIWLDSLRLRFDGGILFSFLHATFSFYFVMSSFHTVDDDLL